MKITVCYTLVKIEFNLIPAWSRGHIYIHSHKFNISTICSCHFKQFESLFQLMLVFFCEQFLWKLKEYKPGWQIVITPGLRGLTNSFSYRLDGLTLYNGDSSASPLIGKYCGILLPPNFISSTNRAFINFRTSSNWNRPGFELKYKAISGKLVQFTDRNNFEDSY